MVARETWLYRGLLGSGLPPEMAVRVAPGLVAYEKLLLDVAVPRGFISPGDAARLAERHVLDSAALYPLLDGVTSVIDVGSGAGLPGVVLAVLGAFTVTLLEAEGRRWDFLLRVIGELGLDAQVVRGRAEKIGHDPRHREGYDAAVARALGKVPVALELTMPLVRPGGRVVLAVGRSALAGLEAASRASEALGGGEGVAEALDEGSEPAARWALTFQKRSTTPDRYPRRTGVPSRRPLG